MTRGRREQRETEAASAASPRARGELFGCGLSAAAFSAVLFASIALFVFWGGPLWSASRGESHVGRFAVSYLCVPPIVVALQGLRRRASWAGALTATGSLWAIKLVVTAILYLAVVPSRDPAPSAERLPPPPPRLLPDSDPACDEYRPARGDFARGTLTVRVLRAGSPLEGAIVHLQQPPPGLPLSELPAVEIATEGTRYEHDLYVVLAGSTALVANRDASLHTLHARVGSRTAVNQPLTPGAPPRPLPPLDPALYELGCDTHATELAWLLVLDHPYVARTRESGVAELADVPAAELTVVALFAEGGALRRASRPRAVAPSERAEVAFDLAPTTRFDPSQEEMP